MALAKELHEDKNMVCNNLDRRARFLGWLYGDQAGAQRGDSL